jgi:chromosome partitioning protein
VKQIVSFANQKGGVGKTTTAVNLAAAVAGSGYKVLLIDLDPQGNATTGLGSSRSQGAYDLLSKGSFSCVKTAIDSLDLVPSSIDLSGIEIELASDEKRVFYLKKVLENVEGYDYIFIDCPPAMGVLTLNGLVASTGVMVPLQCEFYAMEGLSFLVNTIDHVRQKYNKNLCIQGIALTMYDRRNNLSLTVAREVRSYFKGLVYNTVVPRNIRISEAPSHGKPVLLYDHRCAGSVAYIELAKEFLKGDGYEEASAG